jgi:chromosome partitioning protein
VPSKAIRAALDQEKYSGTDLWKLRKALRLFPQPLGNRKQLFLNFKGGTGKTSLSTSYAYRLAELGYSVLLLDLDSQGHATKCLGYEGEDFEKTLLHVLVRKVPLSEAIQHTPLPNLDFVPSNLGMSTVDLADADGGRIQAAQGGGGSSALRRGGLRCSAVLRAPEPQR